MTEDLQQLTQIREIIDRRYDDLKSGRVQPIDGEDVFAALRRKSDQRRAEIKSLGD